MNTSQKIRKNTGNSAVETKKEKPSILASGRKSKKSTQQKPANTLPKRLRNDPSILLAQYNDILLAMSEAGWFVHIAERDAKSTSPLLAVHIKPPNPHIVGITGAKREPVITLDGKRI